MKRNIVLSIFVCLIILTAGAQNEEDNILPSDRNHWTASVSYDATIPGKRNDEVTGAFGLLEVKTDVRMDEYRISIGVGYIF